MLTWIGVIIFRWKLVITGLLVDCRYGKIMQRLPRLKKRAMSWKQTLRSMKKRLLLLISHILSLRVGRVLTHSDLFLIISWFSIYCTCREIIPLLHLLKGNSICFFLCPQTSPVRTFRFSMGWLHLVGKTWEQKEDIGNGWVTRYNSPVRFSCKEKGRSLWQWVFP